MLKIKGLGPKKIITIWKELGIESIGELLYACEENRLINYKGFGAKTQQSIQDALNYYLQNQGSFLYQQVESTVAQIENALSIQKADGNLGFFRYGHHHPPRRFIGLVTRKRIHLYKYT
jgi:DNA polymerase (family 10)